MYQKTFPKKHRSHMSADEYGLLINKVFEVKDKVWCSYHTQENMIKRHISIEEINKVFDNYDIVEFNQNNGDARVLLREYSNRDYNVCVSVNLHTGCICTCYINDSKDSHNSLREEEYTKDLDIKGILQ